MKLKQQVKKERKLDEKVLVEHLEWEQAQLTIVGQDHQEFLLWKRSQMREAQLGAMELERRRNTVATMSKSFFDKLVILSAPQAMEVSYLLAIGRLSGMKISSDPLLWSCRCFSRSVNSSWSAACTSFEITWTQASSRAYRCVLVQ